MPVEWAGFTAFVLAGGMSRRMGSDKAFVQLRGQTLLQRILETARVVTPQVMIVGEKSKFTAYGTVVEDVFQKRGPLGGIHSALAATATDLNLILAVDLPFLEPRFLTYLYQQARESNAMVTLPRAAGGWQPLCAVYQKAFGRLAERALKSGDNKIDSLFADVPVALIAEQEIARAGFSPSMFRNINTLEELKAAR